MLVEGDVTVANILYDTHKNVGGETPITMLLPSFGSRRAKAILCHLVLPSTGVVVLVLVHLLPLSGPVVNDLGERSLGRVSSCLDLEGCCNPGG